jgi:hypothetical protein
VIQLLVFVYGVSFVCSFYVFYYLLYERKGKNSFKPYFIRQYEDILDDILKQNSLLKRMTDNVDGIIARSGIKKHLSFLNASSFFIIDLILFIGAFGVFKKLGLLAGFMYSCVVAYLPFAILMFVSAINTRKIKKTYLTFLNTFSGFYNLEGNIINAIAQTAEYMPEPLKSILKRHIEIYKRSMKSTDEWFDELINEVGDGEFRKFFKFAKLNAKYGGNFERALVKFREQGEKLASIEATKTASASVGTMVILLMIGICLLLIFNISSEYETMMVLKNTVTGQMIAASNAAAIIFGLYMIKHINSSV